MITDENNLQIAVKGDVWKDGLDLNRVPHEHLMADMYYESGSVSRGRSTYDCEQCGKSLPPGTSHATHKFYGEDGDWPTYRTCHGCSDKFEKSLRIPSDGESEY